MPVSVAPEVETESAAFVETDGGTKVVSDIVAPVASPAEPVVTAR